MKNIRYINAGAGSGKTHTLSHILSDSLLGQKGRPTVDSSEVILTTFTKAAAAEFREKARAALIEAGHPEKAAELEGAAIGTVHSVCEQFVRKYWFSLGLSPQMKVISDEDRDFYVNQSISRLATSDDIRAFNDFCRSFKVSKQVNNRSELNFEFWKDYAKCVIDAMTTYGMDSLDESRSRSYAAIDAVYNGPSPVRTKIKDFLDRIETLFRANLIDKKKGTVKASVQELIDAVTALRREMTSLPSLYKMYGWINDDVNKLAGGVNYLKDFKSAKPEFKLDAFSRCLESWMTASDFGTVLKDIVRRVFRIAELWRVDYVGYKADNQILDFDDLEQYFLKILKNPEYSSVRTEIGAAYKILMVDEFQDSNPVQLQIFDALSDLVADNGGETFWVGDPKQSIYAFRGSDTNLITRITSGFVPETADPNASLMKKAPLSKSWRSRPELVDVSNAVFTGAFSGELEAADVVLPDKARPYNELHAPCMLHWDSASSAQSKCGKPDDLAQKIYDILYVNRWDVIRKKRDDESEEGYEKTKLVKIEPRNVAVLCRDRADVKNVVNAFRSAGLPVSATEPDIMDWAEVQLVLALLRFIVDNSDMGARADIAHLLGDMTVEQILNDRHGYIASKPEKDEWTPSENLFSVLAGISKRTAGLSVSDILPQLILELGLYEYVQKWDYADARRQNLGLLQRLATQYEEHCLQLNLSSSVVGYINYIATLDVEMKNEDTTSDTVKVMTYHKAKGLEWNVVCLYNLNNAVADEDTVARKEFCGVTSSYKATGERYIHFFPNVFGQMKSLPAPVMSAVKANPVFAERLNNKISEERRLLYVGFTRARDYLVSFSKKDARMSWIADCNAGAGTLSIDGSGNASVWSNGLSAYEDISGFTAGKVSAGTQTSFGNWEVATEKVSVPKYINPSKVALNISADSLNEVFTGSRMVEAIKDEDKCGTCTHNIFAAFNPKSEHPANVAMAERIISGMGLSSQLPSAESVIESAEQFFRFLADEYSGENEAMRETPFLLELDGVQAKALGLEERQLVRGEIDLVWVTDSSSKKCVLVDYKSYHGNPNINSTNPEVQKHYSGYAPQLLAYKTALEADGWTVEDVLIYYHIQGRAVKFELM